MDKREQTAKDTVIKDKSEEMITCPNCHASFVILYHNIREAQAEITWKECKETTIALLSEGEMPMLPVEELPYLDKRKAENFILNYYFRQLGNKKEIALGELNKVLPLDGAGLVHSAHIKGRDEGIKAAIENVKPWCAAREAKARAEAFEEAKKQERENTITRLNKMLEPAKLTICRITIDGQSEPIDYGLADENGDEIDIAILKDTEHTEEFQPSTANREAVAAIVYADGKPRIQEYYTLPEGHKKYARKIADQILSLSPPMEVHLCTNCQCDGRECDMTGDFIESEDVCQMKKQGIEFVIKVIKCPDFKSISQATVDKNKEGK